jgi:uncharacterized protein YfaS (alpha-2-macroglobulin family)
MRARVVTITLALAVAAAGAYYWLTERPREAHTDGGAFALVSAMERTLDGQPALALTFSQPLDSRKNYDKLIDVFEMPPRTSAARPAAQGGEQDSESRRGEGGDDKSPPAVSTDAKDTEIAGGNAVKHAWVVGSNPRLLYFPHVKPETRYVVNVKAELTSAAGAALNVESRYSIRTAAVSPTYYFASKGMVLPARQNGGLPVVTVNVAEVDIQFLRVKTAELARFLDHVIAPARKPVRSVAENEAEDREDYDGRSLKGAIESYHLDRIHDMAESVYLGRFLTERKANKRAVTYIPVEDIKELKQPGIYVAVMSQPGRFRYEYQTTYFYVSDLGLAARVFEKSADAYVSSLADGKAIAKVEVSWLDGQGKVLNRAVTDEDGRASLAERPAAARVLLARKGEQISLIALREPALDLSEYDVLGLPFKPVRLFAYSGRDLYRPGEKFDVAVLARNPDGEPVPSQPIQAIFKRPDGKTHFTSTWQSDANFPGYYQRSIELPADAPTGAWSLELRADPADKSPAIALRIGVEEFLPERMKLDLKTTHAVLDAKRGFDIQVTGTYLYGAPAAGNRLLGVVQFERSRNPLAAKLPGFEFGDINDDARKSRVELDEASLDASGVAKVGINLEHAAARRSPYLVRATLSLLESGGRPVIRSIERIHWPAPVLIGVRPLFAGDYAREGSNVEFEVIRADADGALKAGDALTVRLFREERQYYWRFEDQRGWHSGFTETEDLVATTSTTFAAGSRGKVALPVTYGRYRIEVTDPETKLTARYRFYAGYGARAEESQGMRPDRVALKLDKAAYAEGETVKLTVTPPHAGELLLTVEGDRTLWVKRMPIAQAGRSIDIALAKEWRRHDLYVSAIVLRPGNDGDRVTPARALGVQHIPLARAKRKLDVSLEAPKKMLPETPMKVKVRVPDARGEKALVTLSAVDAGILSITSYATPDPHAFFFAKLRYGADQFDVYGRIIEKMSGQRGRLKFGGDDTPKPTRSLPKRVQLIDLFSGPVTLDAQGEAEITLNVPDFNGTLRLMAMVAAPQRFGATDAEVSVAAPVVAELLTPRFLTVGDSATIALDLHNLAGSEQKLAIRVEAPDSLRIGERERAVVLKDQHKTTLRFPIDSGTAIGLTDVRVKVLGGPVKIERAFTLDVIAATPRQQTARRFSIAPGETLELREPELGGFLRSTVHGHVMLSNRPPIDVRTAIQGLLTYPYGCAEQTTSTAYPHIFIDEGEAKRFGLKPFTREQRVALLDKAIGRLGALQAPNGGFSLWGQVSEYEYWLSAYVSNFLLDARAQNFAVPDAMHKRATDFLLRGLQEGIAGLPAVKADTKLTWNETAIFGDRRYAGSGRFAVLAYGGYVLARESKAPLATLRQLHESRALAHSGLALVQLGIALRLMGDETRAAEAIAEGLRKPRVAGHWWGDYGSNLRDAALSLALLRQHKISFPGQDNLLAVIAAEMSRPQHWYSTQEKLALFLVGRDLHTADEKAGWRARIVSGASQQPVSTAGTHFRPLTTAEMTAGIRISNVHDEKLYGELSISGHVAKLSPPPNEDILLKRSMFAADGTALPERALRVGEAVLVRLTVKSRGKIANGLVIDRIPAGLEIENLNIVQGEKLGGLKVGDIEVADAMKNPRIQHVEFREDRFVAAVKLEGETHLFYRARVVTPGKFVVPQAYAEDMYRPQLYGVGASGDALTIVDVATK